MLHWCPDRVKEIMRDHDIRSRDELATKLSPAGISRATVYRAFDATWAGRVTTTMLASLASTFKVPVGDLVREPKAGKNA